MRGTKWIGQAYRRLESRFVDGGLILLYHSVADRVDPIVSSDPYALQVSAEHFAEQMEVLGSEARVLPLQAFVKAVRERKLTRRSVAVTFDDGYADNLHCAYPVLRRFGLPATIYVAAGPTGGGHEFWWDELARLLYALADSSHSLSIRIRGQWQGIRGRDRDTLLRLVYRKLRPLSHGDRVEVLAQLRDRIPTGATDGPFRRSMSPKEIEEVAGSDLIQIGAHTTDHPVLTSLSLDAQRSTISENKGWLEDVTGRPVETFAYPYGQPSDFTRSTADLVRELGFAYACSGSGGVAWRGSDPYRLPRLWVRDWSGDAFARWLDRWWRDSVGDRPGLWRPTRS
jgi:peptidoglycan/xylan/chitin deacetylase (PgdA/CDA1 family)